MTCLLAGYRSVDRVAIASTPADERSDELLRVDCPHCGHWAILPNQAADRKAKCLKCKGIFRVQVKGRRAAPPADNVPLAVAQVVTDADEIARIERMVHPSHDTPAPKTTSARPAGRADEDAILDMLTGDDTEMSAEDLANIRHELGGDERDAVADSADAGDTSLDLAALSEGGAGMAAYLQRLASKRSDLLYRLGQGVIRAQATLPARFAPLQAAVKEAVIDLDQVEGELKQLDREAQEGLSIERQAEMLAIRARLTKRRERLQSRIGRRYRRLGKALFLDDQ